MKKGIVFLAIFMLLLSTPNLYSEENRDLLGTLIWKAPTAWTYETTTLPFHIVGSLFGLEGDPSLNENYGGYNGVYGYYESFSDESFYRYQRWGVN